MAYMVARTEKRKIGSLGGYQNHVDRKTKNHSNKDIDDSKTHLNYDLIGHERSTSFHEEFMDYIKENRVGSRAVRKDAVIMQDWLISSSQEFFDTLNENETKRYFETAVEFFAEKFGRENIRFATVHMDEKTPHMHMGIVPLKDGKLTAKTIFDRNCLRMIQNELPQAFQKAGFDIQRGEPKSEKVHLHPEEYKATMRAAQEKSKDIVREAEEKAQAIVSEASERVLEDVYEAWAEDWLETKKIYPDFEMKFGDFEIPLFEKSPRLLKLSLRETMDLFIEKAQKLAEYVKENLKNTMLNVADKLNIKISHPGFDEFGLDYKPKDVGFDYVQESLISGVEGIEKDFRLREDILAIVNLSGKTNLTITHENVEQIKQLTPEGRRNMIEQLQEQISQSYKRPLSQVQNETPFYSQEDEMEL